ncbi:MAG: TIGR04282 family arsenosugar biosynthesis glycosyltransferase [Candidatus Aureabacteria bacterium]|nr:TIGR04282 family arsenosugar biosynthesis glycosyltransferase [Candidatus Auribacterota bacterium]
MQENALIIFVKYPESGLVKTRLAKTIGKDEAAQFYRILVENILENCISKDYRTIIFYSGNCEANDLMNWLGKDLDYIAQVGGSIGERMFSAFRGVFQKEAGKVVLIGSDCLFVNAKVVQQAFKELEKVHVTIGPSKDGGYYLLGLSRLQEEIFNGIDWSTDKVMEQTKQTLNRVGVAYSLIDEYFDIDTFEDIERLKNKITGNNSHIALSEELRDLLINIKKK